MDEDFVQWYKDDETGRMRNTGQRIQKQLIEQEKELLKERPEVLDNTYTMIDGWMPSKENIIRIKDNGIDREVKFRFMTELPDVVGSIVSEILDTKYKRDDSGEIIDFDEYNQEYKLLCEDMFSDLSGTRTHIDTLGRELFLMIYDDNLVQN